MIATMVSLFGSSVLLLLCFSTTLPSIYGAHSRRRPSGVVRQAEPRYDRSITTFSASGRLQQVEYGMEASKRGETIVAYCKDAVIVALVSSSSSFVQKVHRLDEHVYLFTCGLVGDGRALAGALRTECQRFRLTNGQAPSIRDVARFAAQIQHDLTREGGRRPLGCTAVVAGVDELGSQQQPHLFQTDPGGILEECQYCAAGKEQDKAMESLQELEAQWSGSNETNDGNNKATTLGEIAQEVAMAAIRTTTTFRQESPDEEESTAVDVWIIQPNEQQRGKTQTTCVRRVTIDNVNKLRELFEE